TRPIEHHAIQLSAAIEIEKLVASRSRLGKAGKLGDLVDGLEAGRGARRAGNEIEGERAEVAFVVPAAAVLGEDALHALAIEVEPTIARAVHARWNVSKAFRVDLAHLLLHLRFAVFEFKPGQRAL